MARGARARAQVAAENLHRRGLARAVRSEEGHDLALGYGKGNVLHGDEGTVVLAQVLRLDHGFPGHPCYRSFSCI